jgi:hypothetical protein
MSPVKTLPEIPDEDSSPISWAPWLTHRRLTLFVIGWLVLFAVFTVFVSNPFQSETSASATPDYARVMFLHGLLIGMVGLMALLTCQVMHLRSKHVRLWIAGGVVVATILAAVGGIWDRSIPGSEVPMWTQIFGFFALDEILVLLMVGLVAEWRRGLPITRTLPFVVAFFASAAMLLAAVMGHLAGWIMEFGNVPSFLGNFAHFAGFASLSDFAGALVGSHSHQMAVGGMALTITLFTQQFGHGIRRQSARVLANTGMVLITIGTIVMAAMYLAGAFANWAPPTWFVSGPGGANGIASDDIISGILVMGGGLLVIAGFLVGGTLLRRPARVAAAWAWILSFATVVVAGFAIEMNEAYFGAGDAQAAGAAKDAVFTWLHQDIGLFLLPAIVLVMLASELLVDRKHLDWIGWSMVIGTTMIFVGGMVYVFVTPDLFGPGYIITTLGLLVVGFTLLITLWWGAIGRRHHEQKRVSPPPPVEPEQIALPPLPTGRERIREEATVR